MTKNKAGREKGLFDLYFHITVHHGSKSGQEFKQERNLESEPNAEVFDGVIS